MQKLFTVLVLSFLFIFPALAADMPAVGSKAPAFSLPNQEGKKVSLSKYLGKWVVLYFYPKDFSHGCSIEAHNFQQDIRKYAADRAVILGVSVDSPDSHKGFCAKEGLHFQLLADKDHAVSGLYGSALNLAITTVSARHTFLIDPKGVIRKVYADVNPDKHSAEVLSDLGALEGTVK